MELRNKSVLHSQDDLDQATSINAKLSKWWNEVEDIQEHADSALEEDDCTGEELRDASFSQSHQTILSVLKNECVISLNRPILASSKRTAGYMVAVQGCISASKAIINTLDRSLKRSSRRHDNDITKPSRRTDALIWPSFTWAVWMSAFVLIYAAAENQMSNEVALR